jgi:hypothetical protein
MLEPKTSTDKPFATKIFFYHFALLKLFGSLYRIAAKGCSSLEIPPDAG